MHDRVGAEPLQQLGLERGSARRRQFAGCSGRNPMVTWPTRLAGRAVGRASDQIADRHAAAASSRPATRFIAGEPMKPATNTVAGRS